MGATYKTKYGVDWPSGIPDPLIGLIIGKKWRQLKDRGADISDPWVPMLDSAKMLLSDEYFRVSEWSEQHFHDFVMYDKLVTWGCASSGKSLLLDEPVFYPDHVGAVREVKVGDFLLSATGRPTRVRAVFRHFNRPLYRVSFADGSSAVCCDEHLWTVKYWGRTGLAGLHSTHKSKYGWLTCTMSAEELSRLKPGQIRRRRMLVPLTAPVDFIGREVPVDPYVLGCLVGGGSVTQTTTLSFCGRDPQLREEMARRLPAGYVLKPGGPAAAYMIAKASGTDGRNEVVESLKELGLYRTVSDMKFIPDQYKVNSVSVRCDVLAGLLDTAGAVSRTGEISFVSDSGRLADDVKFLAESIGACVTVSCGRPFCRAVVGRAEGTTAYTVRILGLPLSMAQRLFKSDRKRSRLREAPRGDRSLSSVEIIEDRCSYDAETRCIALDETDIDGNPVDGLFPIHDFIVTHNSNDTALLLILDWMVDPFDTVTLLGSTTKQDLKSRSWEAIVRYHNALRHNKAGWLIPGKISKQGQALVNVDDDDIAASAGEKAGIQGRALNEDGRLQGAHAKYVRLVVDELAEITNHEAIKVAMANLRVGTESFKFIGLANPESWENPSCQYCMPEAGPASVDVDTGSWMSTFGCFVRHHDGLKSPCVKDPKLRDRFPFLLSQEEVDATFREAGGNDDAPQFWKMIRGFPVPSGSGVPAVLDARIAEQQHAMDPVAFNPLDLVATSAGVDPAWSEGGDGAYRARCYIRRDGFGRPYLDFTGGLKRLDIHATSSDPPVKQMRDQVIDIMRRPYEASFANTAIDASANQGLADDLLIYAGANCLAVNNSVRASEEPLRANDPRQVKETIYDRGTEAWCVLAEFVKAGQVRGLPAEALRALTSRRFAMKKTKSGLGTVAFPLRLESKDDFKKRFKHSPDECDACALAALAAKERLGFMPFGYIAPQSPTSLFQNQPHEPAIHLDQSEDYSDEFDDSDDGYAD